MSDIVAIKKIKLNKKLFYNTMVLLAFLSLDFFYFYSSKYVLLILSFLLALASFFFFVEQKALINSKLLIVLVLITISSLFNIIVIGNHTVFTFIYLLLSFFSGLFFLSDSISERTFLIATYLGIMLILIKYISVGDMNEIFSNSSRNYVSVLLLYSLTMYYIKAEKKIRILPALMTFIVCVIAIGRGGIISSGLLLVFVILIKLYKKRNSSYIMLFFLLLSFFIAIFIAILTDYYTFEISVLFERFAERGMKDTGRIPIWRGYLLRSIENGVYFTFGAPIDSIPEAMKWNGNLHNSFLFIHAYNGILLFATVIMLIIYSITKAINERNMIYVACFLTFIIRGFLDAVFWGSGLGTPVFMAFLLFYLKNKSRIPGYKGE